jgi:curved DNA-binding protein CbpA
MVETPDTGEEIEEWKGVEEPSQIQSRKKALEFLGLDEEASEDDIESARRELAISLHPDQGGTPELFKALDTAAELAKGGSGSERRESSPSSGFDFDSSGAEGEAGTGWPGDVGGKGGASEGGRFDDLEGTVEEILRENAEEEELIDRFGQNATYENMAEVLAWLIVNGSITLGDVNRIVSARGEAYRGGSSTGGVFGKGGGGIYGNTEDSTGGLYK